MAVTRITIHHEAGAGTGYHDLAAYGYTAEDYNAGTHVFRTAVQSWATAHYNHVSFDIVLSGNRMNDAVTDADIIRIADLVRAGVARGEIATSAEVYPHGTLYPVLVGPGGSSPTQCPGTNTVARWPEIYKAVHDALAGVAPPAPEPKVHPMYSPGLGQGAGGIVAVWRNSAGLVRAAVADNGDVYVWDPSITRRAWPTQRIDFYGRHAAKIGPPELPGGEYTITATSGEKYTP